MAHDSRTVANALIQRSLKANRPLTPMQIIKLVCICHGWMLGLYGRSLVKQPIEAWRYGPVVPDVYRSLKSYGGSEVDRNINVVTPDAQFDESEDDLIDQVLEKYGGLSGVALSQLTHAPGTPWRTVWNNRHGTIISNDLIQDHYAEKAKLADE